MEGICQIHVLLSHIWQILGRLIVLFVLKYVFEEINLNIIIKRREGTVLLLFIFLFFFIFFVFSQKRQKKTKKSKQFIRKEDANFLLLLNILRLWSYHRARHTSPQVVNIHITPQPDKSCRGNSEYKINNLAYSSSKDQGSDSDIDTWSCDKIINEVF